MLDVETDTSKADSALVVLFGAVRKAELKKGAAGTVSADAADINLLEERHIYAV